MTTAPVSVVVPVSSVDQSLRVQLEALSRQVCEVTFEVVVVCNAGSAAAARALDELVRSIADPRFRVVDASQRRGAAHARNVGAAAAGGTVLAFCDADDVVDPGWLAALVQSLDDVDAVGGQLIDIAATERQRNARPPTTPGRLPEFFGVPYIVSASMAVAREAFERVGGFDEDLVRCEDIAFSWQLLVAGGRIGFAPAALVSYHHRPGLRSLVQQHLAYGRGMGQLLVDYGIPGPDGFVPPTGWNLMRPNPSATPAPGRHLLLSLARRAALAVGRAIGVLEARRRRRVRA